MFQEQTKGDVIYTLLGGKDRLFDTGNAPAKFSFNDKVADVFDDMVTRSVPMYQDVTRSVVDWAFEIYQEGTAIYDIGCSTGTTIDAIARKFSKEGKSATFIGIDSSEPMIYKAIEKLSPWLSEHEVMLRTEEAKKTRIQNASMVIMNYTLQFIPVFQRQELLNKVYSGMNSGGVFILAEKVKSSSKLIHKTQTKLYEQFKSDQGYSRTEIEKKKEALEKVLIPLTLEKQIDMLRAAGFEHVEPIYKWNNFVTLVAVKS
jgi:tRNA (cmo5U34)-methyltransferase